MKKILSTTIIFLLLFTATAFADLTLNLVAVNPSDYERKINVKYALPIELTAEAVIDSGILKVGYDVDTETYFVYGQVIFAPKESKTFKVKVKDVWRITPEQIENLKQQLEKNLFSLDEKENITIAERIRDNIYDQLDYILAQQANYSENVGRRIEEYRAYKGRLNQIKQDVYNLDFFEYETKAFEDVEEAKTIKLVIEVQNPSKEETKNITHKHFLPEEVRAQHLVDKQGFDVRFDQRKNMAYLYKNEEFLPGETKKYEFLIKDIWQFSISKADALQEKATAVMDELKESIFEESAFFLFESIVEKMDLIRYSQDQELAIKEHIGLYRINNQRYDEAKDDLERLDHLLALIRAKRLEELESSLVENVLSRLAALRGLAALSEAIFQKGISVSLTWKIIMGTIIFVGVFTGLHFFIWAKRSKHQGESLGQKYGGKIKKIPLPGENEENKEEDIVTE